MSVQVIGRCQNAGQLAEYLRGQGYEVESADVPNEDDSGGGADAGGGAGLVVWLQNVAVLDSPLMETQPEDWQAEVKNNMLEAFHTAQNYYESLKAAQGHLIFVVAYSSLVGKKGQTASAAAGEGVRVMAKGITRQWKPELIKTHTLAVDADFLLENNSSGGSSGSSSGGSPQNEAVLENMAKAISFLTSPEGSSVNGSTLMANAEGWTTL